MDKMSFADYFHHGHHAAFPRSEKESNGIVHRRYTREQDDKLNIYSERDLDKCCHMIAMIKYITRYKRYSNKNTVDHKPQSRNNGDKTNF